MDETTKKDSDESYNFNVWMIVYSPNKKRVNNFNFINKSIHANYFPAIDSISHFKIYSDFAIHKNYCTTSYRDKFKYRPGKLGCNLSHQLLLDTVYETSDTEWNLILEDDVHIDINIFMKDVQRVLQQANEKNCSYIQLYIHPKFIDIQTKQKEKQRKNNEQKLKKYLDSYGKSKTDRQNSSERAGRLK